MKILGKRSAKFWKELCLVLLKLFIARNSATIDRKAEQHAQYDSIQHWVPSAN